MLSQTFDRFAIDFKISLTKTVFLQTCHLGKRTFDKVVENDKARKIISSTKKHIE